MRDRASVDDRLSAEARSLFAFLTIKYPDENVPAAMTLTQGFPMGRDRIRRAMNELIDAGYMERDNYRQRGGQMVKVTRIVAGHTEDWFSGHLPIVNASNTTDSGLVTKDDLLVTSASTRASRKSEEANASSDGRTAPARGRKISRVAKPVSKWTIPDLAQEFYDRVSLRTQSFGQVNFKALVGNIARWRRAGVTQEQILQAINLYFDDPRNLHEPGQGVPLWKRFVTWYTQNQQLVSGYGTDPWEEFNKIDDDDGVLLTRKRF